MVKHANILGEIRAETDQEMLDRAFLETVDYKTIIGATDKTIVVGRRGTGKSALAYRFSRFWGDQSRTKVITLAPTDDQMIGLRYAADRFGGTYNQVKTGIRIAFECLVMLEIANCVAPHYKAKKHADWAFLDTGKRSLGYDPRANFARNLYSLISKHTLKDNPPELNIAELAQRLDFTKLKESTSRLIADLRFDYVILLDRLDEGYEPDLVGSAMVSGIIQGMTNLGAYYENVRPLVFVRDNMYRSIIKQDPDYTRNIEGAELRLHWEEQQLYQLTMLRFKSAFSIEQKTETKVWNQKVSSELKGIEGFRLALRLTLYRPRDLLSLLNEAFVVAARSGRETLIMSDLEGTARHISQVRLDDLRKEYEAIFPAVTLFTGAFANAVAEMTASEAKLFLSPLFDRDDYDQQVQSDMVRLQNADRAIRELYSIGFVGLMDDTSSSFRFCHDGRSPDISILPSTKLMIHPCYQIALNLTDRTDDPTQLQDIHDDYRIELSSASQEDRNKRVGQLVSRLRDIELGRDDASEFEVWSLDALRLIFAGSLRSIDLHPNKSAVQRRDIVAENNSETRFWERIYQDYKARHVIFEIKNKAKLGGDDFRQMASYLVKQYGKFGVILYRSERKEPDKGEIAWTKEIFEGDGKLIVPMSVRHVTWSLEKIRNPEKYDAVDRNMARIVTAFERQYLAQKS